MYGNGIAIGPGLLSGRAKVFNDFNVHTNIDEESGISIGIEGPSNAQMRYTDNEDGSIKVSYKPQVPGYYKISVKQNGLHLKGSPFEVAIYDSTGRVGLEPFLPKSSFTCHQEKARQIEHSTNQLSDLQADLILLNTYIENEAAQNNNNNNNTNNSFPTAEGPFGCPNKVKVSGRGLFRGITNVQSEIVVDTRKAGLGRVTWTISGPGNVQTRHVHIVSGLHKLYYIADARGLYVVKVKFNEQDVPGSPFKLRIM